MSLTQAGIMLKMRYLRVRDLASQGLLGDVKRTETGRYYVKESAVKAYMKSQTDTSVSSAS